jgi:hypothetical protein
MRSSILIRLAGVTLLAAACSSDAVAPVARQADAQSWGPEVPNFNLEVILRGNGFGLVKFRQPNDQEFRVYLDTWVRDLEPNTTYVLERAVDQVLDGVCTSTAWLNLGTVLTDDKGGGSAALSRLLPATLDGQHFDIYFHMIKQSDASEVLTSDCYRYVVSL